MVELPGLPDLQIREEQSGDRDAIRQVTIAAFTESEFGHNGEADLIDLLRLDANDSCSLVACLENTIVGHILFTPAMIRTAEGTVWGMGLAPLSVTPAFQRKGIGSALINAGFRKLGWESQIPPSHQYPFVVVLGHPGYYPRFGFQPAAQFRITHGFSGILQDVFFIKFPPSTLSPLQDGLAYYHSHFGPQHRGN